MSVPTPTDVASVSAALGEALERAGIRYFVGGSVASSVHGAPRFTRDLDVVVDFSEAQVPAFVAASGPDFDIDEESPREEARRRGSWNIFHVPSMLKIDLFFLKGDPFSASQLARRVSRRHDPAQATLASRGQRIVRAADPRCGRCPEGEAR